VAESFRLLSFNAWLLSPLRVGIARDVARRAELIPRAISRLRPDIVALQEVWGRRWRRRLIAGFAREGYSDFRYATSLPSPARYRAALGNGLIVASIVPFGLPVETLAFRRFTASEEFFVAKGAIRTEFLCGGVTIDLYDVHLGAVGFDRRLDRYHPGHVTIRRDQIRELVDWVEATHREDRPLIMAADLNLNAKRYAPGGFSGDDNEDYEYLTTRLGLVDTGRVLGAVDAMGKPYTFDGENNPYALLGFFRDLPSETIDYVFAKNHPRLRAVESRIVFRDPHELAEIDPSSTVPALSDHYGIMTTFEVG
jgi:endonuclease/exonuclease/phosphatase family metal-dependent hydrolase